MIISNTALSKTSNLQLKVALRLSPENKEGIASANSFVSVDDRRKQILLKDPRPNSQTTETSVANTVAAPPKMFAFDHVFAEDAAQVKFEKKMKNFLKYGAFRRKSKKKFERTEQIFESGADLGGASGIRPPADPKGPPFDTFSEIHFWPTDPKIFLKVPLAPIYTNFERERAPKKRDFFVNIFQKVPKNGFFDCFFKTVLW